jgi:hypothetical protein
MGPALDLVLRRSRPAGADLEREAMKQEPPAKKKVRRLSLLNQGWECGF